MASFDAVLWDYGGVFSASPFTAVEALGREKGVEPRRFLEAVFGPYDQDTDHPWHRLERGEMELANAREEILTASRQQGFEADPIELFAHMAQAGREQGAVGVRHEVVALARRVKAGGHRTAVVTNNAPEFREHWTRSIPVAELFHEIVDSSEVGIRKPSARIFTIALERLGNIAPERAIFVDDHPANVAAAEALGIRGIRMTDDYTVALREIEVLLG